MKFYDIMFKKNKIALFALLSLSTLSFSQKGTQSPYSVFGIGELNLGQYAAFMSMGGTSIACTDSTIANFSNPASYAYFNRNRPVFQIAMNGKFSTYETTTASSSQQNLGLNHFQLGLPIKKNWGASFGLLPYSFTGYTISNYSITDGDTIQFIKEGTGAVTKVFLGLAYKPLNHSYLDTNYSKKDTSVVLKTHMLSLGVHGNYLFGTSARTQSMEYHYNNLAYNSRVESSLRIANATADFGFNYQYFFRPVHVDSLMNGSISIGATYSPGFKLKAYQDLLSYTYVGSFYSGFSASVVDTVENVSDSLGSIYIPEQYKFGFEYRFGWQPSRKGERLLRVAADVSFQKWSNFYEEFGGVQSAPIYKDRISYGIGMEFSPVIGTDPTINIFARTNYRLGFNYTQTELSINGINLDNYGMSFGLGIPMNINSTNTNINLGASLGSMGTTDGGLIREKYIGVYFGISIMPDRNELWFVKRKYD